MMLAFADELRLKLGDGARGIIDLFFEGGVVALEFGVIVRALSGRVGQGCGKGLALLVDQRPDLVGLVGGGSQFEETFKVEDGSDRIGLFIGIDDSQLVMGPGQFRIGGEGAFVIGNRGVGVVVVEILLRLFVIGITGIVVLGFRFVGDIATNQGERSRENNANAA